MKTREIVAYINKIPYKNTHGRFAMLYWLLVISSPEIYCPSVATSTRLYHGACMAVCCGGDGGGLGVMIQYDDYYYWNDIENIKFNEIINSKISSMA